MARYFIALILIALVALPAEAGSSDPAQTENDWAGEKIPSLIDSIRVDSPLTFCGEAVPMTRQEIRERLEKELLLAIWNRPQVILWLKRSRRYLDPLSGMLVRQNLPTDLKYVAVVESALRPHSVSTKGAVGFWQMMAFTGRKYGLTINSRIDERRNFTASSRAALKYLRALHDQFSSWALACAAYNMGERGLAAAIDSQGQTDFYRLYLPLETQRFIFKILAAKLILTAPERFGFHLTPGDIYPPFKAKRVEVDCPRDIHMSVVAEAAGTYYKKMKDLNPQIRGAFLAEGRHRLMVPEAGAGTFAERLLQAARQVPEEGVPHVYRVKSGDSLSVIASRFDVRLSDILRWNGLDSRKVIVPGQTLVIYGGKTP
jgi:hypothetical protein